MSSPDVKEIISSGWKNSDLFGAFHLGSTGLPPLGPFADLCLLMDTEALSLTSLFPEELYCFQGNDKNHSVEIHSEWESDGDVSNNEGIKDDVHNNEFDVFYGLQNLKMEFNKIFKS